MNLRLKRLGMMLSILFLVCLQTGQASAKVESPFTIYWPIDGPVLAGSFIGWLVPSFIIKKELAGPACNPCDPSDLNALDKPVVHFQSPFADVASDVALGVVAGLAVVSPLWHFKDTGWNGLLEDLVIIGETVALSGFLHEMVRHAVRRPRPFMYREGAFPHARDSPGATMSFFSGHTAFVFAAATSVSYIYTLRHPKSRWKVLVWAGSLAGASIVPVARVFAGEHFWTDVIVGAAVGSAFGILIPALHTLRKKKKNRESKVDVRVTAGPGIGGLGIMGRF